MEEFQFTRRELTRLLQDVAQAGASAALIDAGVISPIILRTKAIKLHGRDRIVKLENAKLIDRKQHDFKGRYYFDVKELNSALIAENRHIFFTGNGMKDY